VFPSSSQNNTIRHAGGRFTPQQKTTMLFIVQYPKLSFLIFHLVIAIAFKEEYRLISTQK
jgi:hypothetical protein